MCSARVVCAEYLVVADLGFCVFRTRSAFAVELMCFCCLDSAVLRLNAKTCSCG